MFKAIARFARSSNWDSIRRFVLSVTFWSSAVCADNRSLQSPRLSPFSCFRNQTCQLLKWGLSAWRSSWTIPTSTQWCLGFVCHITAGTNIPVALKAKTLSQAVYIAPGHVQHSSKFFNHHTCTVLGSVRVKLNGNTMFSLKKNMFVNDCSPFSVQLKFIYFSLHISCLEFLNFSYKEINIHIV